MEKLIDTDALEGGKFHSIEDWTPVEYSSWQRGWNDAIDAIISNVSTVDAEEVVRCKDCKYASLTYDGECKYCQRWKEKYDGESTSLYLDGDFYCAFGERRKDG